jgi:pimeloyl-ACP methyl ester carboxylesterase
MHYRRQGSGPTLVLLHGGSASSELCWGPAFAAYAPKFDVIAPDQMGHGRTADGTKRPFDYHAMAEDTVALLAQLGVTSAYFVGWSDGGNIALDIAMHHPSLAKKVVTAGANFTVGGLKPAVLEAAVRAKPEDHPQFIRDDYAKLSPDGAAHWPVFFGRLRKMWTTQPAWTPADLARIKAPTLITAGDDDIMTNEHTTQLAAAIPGARLAIFAQATHLLPLDQAALWNAAVRKFLEAPAPARAAGH